MTGRTDAQREGAEGWGTGIDVLLEQRDNYAQYKGGKGKYKGEGGVWRENSRISTAKVS